jgi:bacterial/archaeal transporter family-2 protein
MEALFVPLAFVAGALLAVQVGANTQLSKGAGGPFAATTLQLAVGTVVLVALAALVGTLGTVRMLPEVTWWHAIGGLASAFYVCSTIALFARLGAVVSVGMAFVLLFVVVTGNAPRPRVSPLTGVPWWGWRGGLCGAAYVTTVFTAITAIGAAAVVGLTVAGQQMASVFFDRWGLMRMPQRNVTGGRLFGVALLLLGVVLIQAL